jgi:hypothetical protein
MLDKINRFLPLINLLVGSTGLTFQISVLYPWHNNLEKKIIKLEQKIKK